MKNKTKKINFWVSVEEFDKINTNAKAFGLATGTYLRLLGVAGKSPFTELAQGANRLADVSIEPHSPGHVWHKASPNRTRPQKPPRSA